MAFCNTVGWVDERRKRNGEIKIGGGSQVGPDSYVANREWMFTGLPSTSFVL